MTTVHSFRTFGLFSRVHFFTLVFAVSALSLDAQTFTTLHNFVFTNGTGPVARLLQIGNTLYGTARTYGGGTAGGEGSVFRMNTDGAGFTNLHTFSAIAPEGGNLNGGLLLSGGLLYSTAEFGGGSNYGCIFAIGTNGLGLTNLYNFSAESTNFPGTNGDGSYPAAGLLLIGDTLYGTANGGGVHGWGSIFAVRTNGTAFTNLHNFNVTNGQYPSADLIVSGGILYGATADGGSNGYGTIFKMNTNGTGYTNFYSFPPTLASTNSDGAFPLCSLVLSGSVLYGTTEDGGDAGDGTIFMINTDGTGFSVLHSFSAMAGDPATNSDGAHPQCGLTLVGNALYGTASAGGDGGNGTVFKINTDGSGFITLHSFSATNNAAASNTDGAHPVGALISSGSNLYGTASAGGTGGYGTVFSVAVPPLLSITLSGTNAILTWPSDVSGYGLESATNLPTTNWNALAGQYSVTNPMTGKQKFYRLVHP